MSIFNPQARSLLGLRWSLRLMVALWSLALMAGPLVRADAFRKDPVEEFRKALLLENSKSITYKSRMDQDDKALEYAIDFREKNLKKAADLLKTTSDLSRALLLIDWPRPPRSRSERDAETRYDKVARDIERRIREDLARRFVKKVQAAIDHDAVNADDVARQIATANLVGETVASAGDLQDESLLLYKDLEPLAKDLAGQVKASNFRVREAAARALGQFPNSPVVAASALKQLLAKDNPESTRLAAATALFNLAQTVSSSQPIRGSEPGVSVRENRRPGKIFFLPDVSALVAQIATAAGFGLSDSSPQVRRQCINALRQAAESLSFEIKVLLPVSTAEVPLPPVERPRSPEEITRIQERLQDINSEIKTIRPALLAFRNEANPLLKAALDSDPEVRLGARRTLDALAQARELVIKLRTSVPVRPGDDKKVVPGKPGVPAAAFPFELGRATRPTTLKMVRYQEKKKDQADEDTDPDPIASMIKIVGEGLVRSGFVDTNPKSRRAAVEALESMGGVGKEFIPQLLTLVNDDDLFVRWIAARTLGKMAPHQAKSVVAGLIPLLDDPDLDPRIAAAYTLAEYGAEAKAAVPALAARVNKGDVEFRIAVMKALEAIGTDAAPALPQLELALNNTNPRARAEAARVIGRFGSLAKGYIEPLRKMTTDPDSEVRKAASAAILTILERDS